MLRKRILCFALAAMLLLGGCGAAPAEGDDSPFTVDFLSTGKSDCAVICMDDLVIVSDTADTDDYDQIARCLQGYGIERIDYIILSHYDKDHIGSAAALILNFTVGTVFRPDYQEDSDEFRALLAALAERDTEDIVLTQERVIHTEHGSLLLDPPDKDYGDDNNNSLLLTVTYEGHSLLFLGDARKKRMEEFLAAAGDDYDLIKLPHHGDSNKPLLQLLNDTAPLWAVEMVSEQEIVESELLYTLSEIHTILFCTRDGAVRVSYDGAALTVEQR